MMNESIGKRATAGLLLALLWTLTFGGLGQSVNVTAQEAATAEPPAPQEPEAPSAPSPEVTPTAGDMPPVSEPAPSTPAAAEMQAAETSAPAETPDAEVPPTTPQQTDAPNAQAPNAQAPNAQSQPAQPPVTPSAPAPVTEAEVVEMLQRTLGDEPGVNGNASAIRFNFAGASWRDVITWFAEEADLSLQADQMPTGTMNFRDPSRSYSVSEGLDVLNRLLLDRGFALVRRGRMLLLVDLENANAAALLSEVAELVMPEDLDARGRSDIVRSVFPLGSMSPDNAKVELAQLIGPSGRVIVLDSARQVIVTETVAKLIAIRELLDNATAAQSNVVEIVLKNRAADELLELARPLLGLEPGENASDDLRLSVGLYGDRIFATGVPSKLSLLEGIIERADTPVQVSGTTSTTEIASPVLQTHPIATADTTTVFDVLQTLLAGTPDARIAVDPKTGAIIASARPDTQELIAKTIGELEGSRTEFEIIDLKRLEPSQALLTINKFFGVTSEGGDGPIVDGDPVTGRLWIRGTAEQIELVKTLISRLEGEDSLGALGDRIRILPYSGRTAEEALNQVQSIWNVTGRGNRIRTITPSSRGGAAASGIPERRVNQPFEPEANSLPASNSTIRDDSQAERPSIDSVNESRREPDYQFVNQFNESAAVDDESTSTIKDAKGAEIIIQLSPSGMIVASEDTEALNAFETLMQTVTQQSVAQSTLPTIFWLKYIKADVASELVSSVLGGAESGLDSLSSSLTGSLGGGMLGGLLGMGGGGGGEEPTAKSVLTSSGSVSIVPDARLNALIVQAGPVDLEFIEMILAKIDQEESPEDIQTVARPVLIPVIYQSATDVANIVKAVFAEKISGGDSQGNRQPQQPSPQDFINALRGGGGGGGRGGGNSAPKSEPAKIAIAVDTRSNSIVVTATPNDYQKVRELVETLDHQSMDSEESVEVVTLGGGIKADVVKQALESVLGTTVKTTASATPATPTSGDSGSRSSSGGDAPSSDDIQRRIEFFRQMRERGGSPFGGGGSPFGGGGSPFGGGRGDSGGGGRGDGGRGGR